MASEIKTILITGASSGIGAALAEAYAGQGVTLILIGRNEARLAEVEERCRARGATLYTFGVDVRDKEKLAQILNEIDTKCPIDLLIANAGVSGGSGDRMESETQARMIFDTNLGGVLNTIHPMIPRMVKRGRGHIAMIASLASICALPSAPAYSASKAAVRYYGESLRGVLKSRGVVVSVVSPGYIETPMTKVNRFYMPFIMPVTTAAARIKHALDAGRTDIFFPRRLYAALYLLRAFPYFLQHFILDRLPSKPQFD